MLVVVFLMYVLGEIMVKKITTLTVALLAILALTACKENTPSTSVENVPTNQAIAQLDNGEIKFSTVPFKYELPQAMKEMCEFDKQPTNKTPEGEYEGFCTQIDIELAKIEPIWIEQIVNKAITNDDSPKLVKFKQTLDEFTNEHLALIHEMKEIAEENGEEFTSSMAYVWYKKPEMLPAFNRLVQIAIYGDMYMGGAHGVQDVNYLIFDMDSQSQIALNDVVKSEKAGELYELYYRAFKNYLAKELEIITEEDIADYEEMWSFELTENFYFNKEGLVLVYSPYEMGAYAQGFIELTVPYDELMHILKEPYLPKA